MYFITRIYLCLIDKTLHTYQITKLFTIHYCHRFCTEAVIEHTGRYGVTFSVRRIIFRSNLKSVASRGGGAVCGAGERCHPSHPTPPPPHLGQVFPKGPPFGITLHPFLAYQPQNFSRGAFDAHITIFEAGARQKTQIFKEFSKSRAPPPRKMFAHATV